MPIRHLRLLATLALALGLAACDSSQSVHPGQSDAAVGTDASAGSDATAGPSLKVTYSGTDHEVDLTALTPQTLDAGTTVVVLADVVTKALPSKDQTTLQTGFLSADGFDPSSKSMCAAVVPVPGTNFAQGYVELSTRNLSWADDLQYPGCLYVKGLAQLTVTDK